MFSKKLNKLKLTFIKFFFFLFVASLSISIKSKSQHVPLGQDVLVKHLDQELSGESAKRNLEYVSRLHRMRGSKDYNQAIEFLAGKLNEYNLESVEIIKIPADGKIMYGTQRSRPAWDVDFAELWELEEQNNSWIPKIKVADWESIPLVLAQDSKSGEIIAELVDIGAGTLHDDFINKNVKGKLVLTSSQPEAVVPLAIEKFGAAGIISYAQNQVTAWWKENENLVRWGHLNTFSETETFAFMISLKQARSYQQRLHDGEIITMHAKVSAEQHSGNYNILTAIIEGSDVNFKNEEIVFSCHLDHPRPGANDNASGSVAILEVARTIKKLILENKIERPKRTLRFIWSPEIEGTVALLNIRPELAKNIRFNIHMDMVGGGPETKAIFNISRSPFSLPDFMNDVGEAFGDFVNQSSNDFASGINVPYPLISKEGGKEPLQAIVGKPFSLGSDHQVYSEGSFRIPSIYLHDWPDRYIHTNYDSPANIDPTKLKRASFIGAGSGYFLANLGDSDLPHIIDLLKLQVLKRTSDMLHNCQFLIPEEQDNVKYYFWAYETEVFSSLKSFASNWTGFKKDYTDYLNHLKRAIGEGKKTKIEHEKAKVIYNRNSQIKGPMTVFGYDYFIDHYDHNKGPLKIFNYSGIRGSGAEYTYEVLNLVNGRNSVLEIRNIVSAEFGPIPLQYVVDYLEALKSINIINKTD